MGDFGALGAAVFGINIDTEFSHKPFAQELGLTFPLLSDMNRDFGRRWDLLADVGPYKQLLKRSAWLIGKGDGVIRYREVIEGGELPDPEPVLEELRKLSG